MSPSILALATLVLASSAPAETARARSAGIVAIIAPRAELQPFGARSGEAPAASPYAALLDSAGIRTMGAGVLACRRDESCSASGTVPSDRRMLRRVGACDDVELDELAIGMGRARAIEVCIDRARERAGIGR